MLEITKRFPGYDSIKFISKAIGGKDNRHLALQYIMINNGKMYATDGHRLHIADDCYNLPVGLYELLKTSSKYRLLKVDKPNATFPNIDNVIPEIKDKDKFIAFEPYSGVRSKNNSKPVSQCIAELYKEHSVLVDYNLLKDLTDIDGWKVYAGKELEPVRFENGSHTAVVMPFRK